MRYDPVARVAFVPTPSGQQRANIGDWIVVHGPWQYEVRKAPVTP